MRIRTSLFREIATMAFVTVRTQKARSALTILGIMIGITSIVGMTAIVRGFDESMQGAISQMGPNTIFIMQFSGLSLAAGEDFRSLIRRPSLTLADVTALDRQVRSIASVGFVLGEGFRGVRARLAYAGRRTKNVSILGTSYNYPDIAKIDMEHGRFFTQTEVMHRRRVVILGHTPYKGLFPQVDPIGKVVRVAGQPYTVIGVHAKRAMAGGLNLGENDFAVIPHSVYQKQFGENVTRSRRGRMNSFMITAILRESVPREDAIHEIEDVIRIRHKLRVDDANDFDVMTQDTILQLWNQISTATYLALVSISSIALLVGGIGVMAIMTISVTERTCEIGTRRALGARKREIRWQFLLEAAFLTIVGGVLGVLFGSGIGIGIHYATGFPISLPWWSFALGIGFSGSIGIAFGLFPAVRAAGLDPIEALRHE